MADRTNSAPLVRVCVPVYNAAATFAASMDSILAQSYRNIEVLVVDNASDDGTLRLAEAYAASDPRVKVLKGETNIGAVPNLMRCISLAAGKYTAIFHADDIYSPEMLEKEAAFLEDNPEAGAVFTMAVAMDSQGNPGKVFRFPGDLAAAGKKLYAFSDIFRSILRNGNFLFTPSPLVRTDVYREEIKELREGMWGTSVDLDLWLRINEAHPIGILKEPLLNYRMAKESFSFNHLRARTGRHDLFKVLDFHMARCGDRLTAEDRINYSLLACRDDIERAFNLFSAGRGREARPLLYSALAPRNLLRSARSVHFKYFVFGCALLPFCFLPEAEPAKRFFTWVRHG